MLSREKLAPAGRSTVYELVLDGDRVMSGFLMSLQEGDRLKLYALIRMLAERGFIGNCRKLRRLEAGIYELKLRSPAIRVFCFRDGPDWICTHGQVKPGKSELRAQRAKVRALRERYVEERT